MVCEPVIHPSGESRSLRYDSLTLWRGVACLLIVVFHSVHYLPVSGQYVLFGALNEFWIGVPIFFVSTDASYTFTADGNRTLVAHFAVNCTGSYALIVGDNELDYGYVRDQSGTVVQYYSGEPGGDSGETETFTVTPGQHYTFDGVGDSGSSSYHSEFYPLGNYAYIDILDPGSPAPYYDGDDDICGDY